MKPLARGNKKYNATKDFLLFMEMTLNLLKITALCECRHKRVVCWIGHSHK